MIYGRKRTAWVQTGVLASGTVYNALPADRFDSRPFRITGIDYAWGILTTAPLATAEIHFMHDEVPGTPSHYVSGSNLGEGAGLGIIRSANHYHAMDVELDDLFVYALFTNCTIGGYAYVHYEVSEADPGYEPGAEPAPVVEPSLWKVRSWIPGVRT